MKLSHNKKGVALLIALSIAIILMLLAMSMLMLVRGHYGTTANQIQHTKASYLAEAGVQYALARCRAGTYSNFNFPENGVTVSVNISAPNAQGQRTIKSSVNY